MGVPNPLQIPSLPPPTSGRGRKPGAVLESTLRQRKSGKDFARDICESAEYRDTVRTRAAAGTLPPAIEALLWYYAYGRPVARAEVDVTVTKRDELKALTDQQLAERAQIIAQNALKIQGDGLIRERDADEVLEAEYTEVFDKNDDNEE